MNNILEGEIVVKIKNHTDCPNGIFIETKIYGFGSKSVISQTIKPLEFLRNNFDLIWEDIGNQLKRLSL